MTVPLQNIESSPLLKMSGIDKSFPGVQALSSAKLEVLPGEVHALVGENGAGKSTLMKILAGALLADKGAIHFRGERTYFAAPHLARKAGIAIIYQEFTLVPHLTAAENIFLGSEIAKSGIVDRAAEAARAKGILDRLDPNIDPHSEVFTLNIAQQQLTEIARALSSDTELLVMDEPTAALSPQETQKLFSIITRFVSGGGSVIFISHKLEEVFQIADRITVMRDGKTIGTWKKQEIDKTHLIEAMVGRSLEREFPVRHRTIGDTVFQVKYLTSEKVKNISFSLRKGEVLGLAGLMGAGRTEAVRLIFGADKKSGGEMYLDGKPVDIRTPGDAIRAGICLLTEDRKNQGLVLKLSAKENFSLSNLKKLSKRGWIDFKAEISKFLHFIKNIKIKLASPDQRADSLSGGNQQKLLLARWLESDSRIFIFDEPTRGIDVGAKYEIYKLIDSLASGGKSIIIVSSELEEIIGICDRILVLKQGEISGEISEIDKFDQKEIMRYAVN